MVQLNQFAPNEPVDGLYVYQANLPQLHNPIISASQSTALTYGAFVAIDTASTNAQKECTLETGARIMVPLFINQGEKIRVKVEDRSYGERVR